MNINFKFYHYLKLSALLLFAAGSGAYRTHASTDILVGVPEVQEPVLSDDYLTGLIGYLLSHPDWHGVGKVDPMANQLDLYINQDPQLLGQTAETSWCNVSVRQWGIIIKLRKSHYSNQSLGLPVFSNEYKIVSISKIRSAPLISELHRTVPLKAALAKNLRMFARTIDPGTRKAIAARLTSGKGNFSDTGRFLFAPFYVFTTQLWVTDLAERKLYLIDRDGDQDLAKIVASPEFPLLVRSWDLGDINLSEVLYSEAGAEPMEEAVFGLMYCMRER